MKVLQIIQQLSCGGLESLTLTLLRNSTVDQHLLSLTGSPEEGAEFLDPGETSHFTFLQKPPAVHLPSVLKLRQIATKLKINIIHSHNSGPLIYGGLAARLLPGVRHIHTFHDVWSLESRKERWLTQGMLRLSKPQIVIPGEHLLAGVKQISQRSPIHVIQNSIDTEHYSPRSQQEAREFLGLANGMKLVGAATRLDEVKGLKFLFAAMEQLPSEWHLAIAGIGVDEQIIKAQAKPLLASGRVHFLGYVKNMSKFYNAVDVICLPSLNEGLPLSILEAQACGVPVVATNVGSTRSGLCPQTGTLVPPGQSVPLAQALKARLATPLTVSPRDFVERYFNLSSMVGAYDRLYGSL